MTFVLRGRGGPVEGLDLVMVPGMRLVVGRGPQANLMLEDDQLSREHFELALRGPLLQVRDLGSRNGTLVNGARVEQATLSPGDELRAGSVAFVVRPPAGATARSPAQAHAPLRCAWCAREATSLAGGASGPPICPGCKGAMAVSQEAFAGAYALEGFVGWGATGEVYRARDAASGDLVALKVVRTQGAVDDAVVRRLLRGLRLTRELEHPGLVKVRDVQVLSGVLVITSTFVEGEDLARRLRRDGALPVAQVLSIGEALAAALAHLHAHGLVHRDVKPSNVLLSRQGVFLTDYALTRSLEEGTGLTLTAGGERVGAFHYYLAPEQVFDARRVDARADVYALGATLYHALVGRPPIGETVFGKYAEEVSKGRPVSMGEAGELPPAVVVALERALQADPARRTPGAAALLEDLARARAALAGGAR